MLIKIVEIVKFFFATFEEHTSLLHSNNLMIAWIKAIGVVGLIVMAGIIVLAVIKRKQLASFWKKFVKAFKTSAKE